MKFKQHIEEITAPYFYDELKLDRLVDSSMNFSAFLHEKIGGQLEKLHYQGDLKLMEGIALGTFSAASCQFSKVFIYFILLITGSIEHGDTNN